LKHRSLILPLALLLLSTAPLLFTIGWQVKQQVIRHRMHEALENSLVHTLVLTPQELSWAIEGKELIINGRLFDVKEISASANGTFEIKGLFDDEETQLLDLVRKKLPDENGHQLISKLIHLQLSLPEPAAGLHTSIPPTLIKWSIPLTEHLPQLQLSILTPPPKAVL
jgi:hypothetical protein